MTSRKEFLAAGSLLALAPSLEAASPKPARKASPAPEPTFEFDRTRFEQILAKPAKHKQCFGATQIDDGSLMFGMNNSIEAYEDYLHEPSGSMQAVAVLYHGASIFLAMNDAAWNDVLTPFFRSKTFLSNLAPEHRADFTGLTLGKGNPFLHSATKDAPPAHGFDRAGGAGRPGRRDGDQRLPGSEVHVYTVEFMMVANHPSTSPG